MHEVQEKASTHVLLSAYACMPESGSEPGYGWNWAVHLALRGMQVTVLTRAENRERIESYLRLHPQPELRFEYVIVPISQLKPTSGLHYALWQFYALRRARRLQKENPFDLVHHVTYTSIHVPTQLWKLGVPTLFGPVGGGQTAPKSLLTYFGDHQAAEQRRTLLTKALRYSPLHRLWLRKLGIILAANTDTLKLVKSLGRRDVRMQSDVGVPTSYLSAESRTYTSSNSPVRLVWVGRLLARKAIPLALDALSQTTSGATLTIVGDGLPEAELRSMIADRGLRNRVHWAGRRLSVAEVRVAYLEHDAFLFTSIRDTCGVQLLEAMAVALPILTLDHHGAHDVVPSAAGIKVPVTSAAQVVRDLAAAIDTFAALSPGEKEQMSRASLESARQSTWSMRAEAAEEYYKVLLATLHR